MPVKNFSISTLLGFQRGGEEHHPYSHVTRWPQDQGRGSPTLASSPGRSGEESSRRSAEANSRRRQQQEDDNNDFSLRPLDLSLPAATARNECRQQETTPVTLPPQLIRIDRGPRRQFSTELTLRDRPIAARAAHLETGSGSSRLSAGSSRGVSPWRSNSRSNGARVPDFESFQDRQLEGISWRGSSTSSSNTWDNHSRGSSPRESASPRLTSTSPRDNSWGSNYRLRDWRHRPADRPGNTQDKGSVDWDGMVDQVFLEEIHKNKRNGF